MITRSAPQPKFNQEILPASQHHSSEHQFQVSNGTTNNFFMNCRKPPKGRVVSDAPRRSHRRHHGRRGSAARRHRGRGMRPRALAAPAVWRPPTPTTATPLAFRSSPPLQALFQSPPLLSGAPPFPHGAPQLATNVTVKPPVTDHSPRGIRNSSEKSARTEEHARRSGDPELQICTNKHGSGEIKYARVLNNTITILVSRSVERMRYKRNAAIIQWQPTSLSHQLSIPISPLTRTHARTLDQI